MYNINFGPQHPSAIFLAKKIKHADTFHRGTEKLMEHKTYHKLENRLDYSYSLAVKKILTLIKQFLFPQFKGQYIINGWIDIDTFLRFGRVWGYVLTDVLSINVFATEAQVTLIRNGQAPQNAIATIFRSQGRRNNLYFLRLLTSEGISHQSMEHVGTLRRISEERRLQTIRQRQFYNDP